jgi:hypothetical protein
LAEGIEQSGQQAQIECRAHKRLADVLMFHLLQDSFEEILAAPSTGAFEAHALLRIDLLLSHDEQHGGTPFAHA